MSAEERALWAKAVRNVKPLRGEAVDMPDESAPARNDALADITEPQPPAASDVPASHRRPPAVPPPLTGLDRRTRQRLARGRAEIEARIDLHGLSVEHARMALHRFLAESAVAGRRLVLVITGKGRTPIARHTLHGFSHFDAPERQGRLRRKLPEWLSESDMRAFVAGYQPAHPRHGGGGAFYVRLRRKDRMEKSR